MYFCSSVSIDKGILEMHDLLISRECTRNATKDGSGGILTSRGIFDLPHSGKDFFESPCHAQNPPPYLNMDAYVALTPIRALVSFFASYSGSRGQISDRKLHAGFVLDPAFNSGSHLLISQSFPKCRVKKLDVKIFLRVGTNLKSQISKQMIFPLSSS